MGDGFLTSSTEDDLDGAGFLTASDDESFGENSANVDVGRLDQARLRDVAVGDEEPAYIQRRRGNIARARATRKTSREETDRSIGAKLLPTFADESKKKACHAILYDAVTSMRQLARTTGADRTWIDRLGIVAGKLIWKTQEDELMKMLEAIETAPNVEPVHFTLTRVSDETPWWSTTYTIDEDGSIVKDTTTNKVMASFLQFALTLETLSGAKTGTHVIHGEFSTPMLTMISNSAPIILTTLRRNGDLSQQCRDKVEQLFPSLSLLDFADSHPSNAAALRQEKRHKRKQGWETVAFRCGVHRARTGERKTVEVLEKDAEKFMLNFTLTLRKTPGAMVKFRARCKQDIRETT
jgi:hypothetical protein